MDLLIVVYIEGRNTIHTIPKVRLSTGDEIPAVGLGTFGSDKYNSKIISEAVYGAVKNGYRMLDCASVYQNENEIGVIIQRLLNEKIITRKELFIISKVWNDMHGEGKELESFMKSLTDLKLSCRKSVAMEKTMSSLLTRKTFVIEGVEMSSNILELRTLSKVSKNDNLTLCEVKDFDHFSVLRPGCELIAKKILADTGPECDISIISYEISD